MIDGREDLNEELPEAIIERLRQELEVRCNGIEEKLDCKLLVLMMAEQWASIERRTVDDMMRFLLEHESEYRGFERLCAMLHSPGGDADAAYQIARLLNRLAEKNNAELYFLIPRMAKSAATLLACSGDEILMTRIAELGPIDPQIMTPTGRWVSARTVRDSINELLEIVEQRRRLSSDRLSALFRELPLMEIGQFNRLIKYARNLLAELLKVRMLRGANQSVVRDVCKKLTEGYEYHGRPIMADEARNLGLKVRLLTDDQERAVLDAYWLFSSSIDQLESYAAALLQALPSPIYMPTRVWISHGILYLPLTAEVLLGREGR